MAFYSLALPFLLAWSSQAARKRSKITRKHQEHDSGFKSNASQGSSWSGAQTTYQGCQCSGNCGASLSGFYKCDFCYTKDGCGTWGLGGRWDYCDFRPSATSEVSDFIARSWESKLDYFWGKITADTSSNQDYPITQAPFISVRTSFDNYRPEMPAGRPKVIHGMGSVCKFNLDVSGESPYTGIFKPGRRTGFLRLGSANKASSGITPGLGIKFTRSGVPDGDFVMLHSLEGIQAWNFFSLNQTNHIEPASGVIAIAAEKFKDASQCPYQVGLSDLATYSQDGGESYPPKFPFKLLAVANPELETGRRGETLDAMHAEIDAIPLGTSVYKLYACAEPSGDEMKPAGSCGGALLLGDMVTASQCTTSRFGDEKMHFRHQRIEEDWLLEPNFMNSGAYKASVACDASSLSANGAPPICGEEGMLATDAS